MANPFKLSDKYPVLSMQRFTFCVKRWKARKPTTAPTVAIAYIFFTPLSG